MAVIWAVDSPHNSPHLLIFHVKAFSWSKLATSPRSANRFSKSLSADASCGTRAEANAIVVRELAACTAQGLFARVPAEPLLFPVALPTPGLSQRSRDRPRRGAEMFFASWARAARRTSSGAQQVQNCDTHLQGWAACPPVFRI